MPSLVMRGLRLVAGAGEGHGLLADLRVVLHYQGCRRVPVAAGGEGGGGAGKRRISGGGYARLRQSPACIHDQYLAGNRP